MAAVNIFAVVCLLLALCNRSATGANVSSNLIEQVNYALVDNPKFANGCIMKTCQNLNGSFFCDFLLPNQVASNYITKYLQNFKACLQNGICGIPLKPLSITGIKLSVENLEDGSNAKCELAKGTSLDINGIPDVKFTVTTDRKATDKPTVNIKIILPLISNITNYNCTVTKSRPNPQQPLQFWDQLINILKSFFGWIFRQPQNNNGSSTVLVVDGITYSISADIKVVFNRTSIKDIGTIFPPTVTVSPVSTSGSASQILQKEIANYLQSYLQSSMITDAIVEIVMKFLRSVFQDLLNICV